MAAIEKNPTADLEKAPIASTKDVATAPAKNNENALELFQLLIGIHTPSNLVSDPSSATPPSSSTREGSNLGLYQRTRDQERRGRIQYILTSFISNLLYMLQIILAATFTALSAYKDSNAVTLTVLGALNTVIAGCLAWQKGQGVPQRYRKAQDQYQALLLEIEMAERSFLENKGLDPRAEKERLQKLFDTARADQQANYPDLYVSTAAKESGELAKQLEDAKAEAAKVQGEMLKKIEELMDRLEGKVPNEKTDKVS